MLYNNKNKLGERMYKDLVSYLKTYKNKTITLSELEMIAPGNTLYDVFTDNIKSLVKDNILIEKNPKNNNGKKVPLPLKFEINKYELKKDNINKIEKYSFNINDEINLQGYFDLNEEVLEKDLPYISKVNEYINEKGLPKDHATSQERSFHITGDEKWIDEKGGKKILERIKVYEKLKIGNNYDPLMLAINPKVFSKPCHYHLVVENKATFLALMDVLETTEFCSLIFGSGWKIVGNIDMLEKQVGLRGNHKIFYFGDLDNEGISIYNSLNEKISVNLAVDFYKELLKKPYSFGKENQFRNESAIGRFISFFTTEEETVILDILNKGGYLPQEGLNRQELQDIWRNSIWE